ncbi:MAG TPA: ATP-binding cassette domain-containing protein [Caulobacteraceae bacterium]|nr:ATP-binding cassette domain-containing protein [Caulobacteraceae bacterium]
MSRTTAADRSAIVEAQALTRRFGEVTAVDSVSFSIASGETFALIGPNGAGKSTLMKMLTTMLPPTSGRATVAGFDVARQPQRVRAHIGYVPQLLSADGELSGYENMLLSARLYLLPASERPARVEAALAMMDLTEAKDRLVRTYSGGMARRLEIAQSTMHRPAVLFMDEPTVGLDPGGRRKVWAHVARLQAEIGAAVVFSTHYMDEAEEVCDRVGLISAGRLAALGAPAALRAAQGPDATLDDVFTELTGIGIGLGGKGQ